MTAVIDPTAISALIEIVGRDHILTNADQRASFETDWTGRFVGSTAAVVRPGSVDDVAAIVELCRREGIAIVAQGGNTGLVGGGVPMSGELLVSLRRLRMIGDVDVGARQISVGAGVVISDLRDAAERAGLSYAVNFGARDSATVGGSIATNAGGINVLRYGGTREQVVGVQAVLGNGSIVGHMHGLIKDNTGYHLPSLLCGSEGTLGIVTAARLRLVSRHAFRTTALIGFEAIEPIVDAVAALRSKLDSLEAAELMLDDGLGLVCDTFGMARPFGTAMSAYLLVEVADHHDRTDELASTVSSLAGVLDVAVGDTANRRAALWRYREDHTLAINTLGPPHKLDVTLPIPRIAEFVAQVPVVVSDVRPGARTWLFGHVGDGNIHVNITGLDPDDDGADDAVFELVAAMNGSISAEHGIGTAKRRWLHLSRTPADIEAMRAIKAALDPAGILNPNVLLPPVS